jgi:predicted transposase/invertase (TIGR01784 family)
MFLQKKLAISGPWSFIQETDFLSEDAAMTKDILPPKSDVVFKLLFGDQRNADLLSDFLKSVFRIDDEEFLEITIVDPHLLRKHPDKKLGIIDLKAKTKSGEIIHIEIQLTDIPQMPKRIVFYGAGLISEQINSGEEYGLIKRVISILIIDFRLIKKNSRYHNRFTLYDPQSATELTDILEIHTLELSKLPEKADNYLWNWLRFIRAESREDLDMVAQTSPMIKKAVGKLLELSQDERARMLFEAREKERRDNAAREHGAREEGKAEEKMKIAQKLLEQNISVEVIAKSTGLPLDKIEQLRDENQ